LNFVDMVDASLAASRDAARGAATGASVQFALRKVESGGEWRPAAPPRPLTRSRNRLPGCLERP